MAKSFKLGTKYPSYMYDNVEVLHEGVWIAADYHEPGYIVHGDRSLEEYCGHFWSSDGKICLPPDPRQDQALANEIEWRYGKCDCCP